MVGWTEISEEQDYANSDFETMIFENALKSPRPRHSKVKNSEEKLEKYRASSNSLKPNALTNSKGKKGSITNVQLLPTDSESRSRFQTMLDDSASLEKTEEEVEGAQEETEEYEGQVLNPELIGAS